MSKEYFPLHDLVLVEKLDSENKQGSILLPTNSQKFNRGLVKKIGPGRKDMYGGDIRINLYEGDVVMFERCLHLEGNLFLVKETDIFCTVFE